jgi:hypothetical protein
MKHLVMLRVLDKDPYKRVIEIDFTKFQFKYRLHTEVIGTIDGIQVAMCVDDYDKLRKEK